MKSLIRKLLRRWGLSVNRLSTSTDNAMQTCAALRHADINIVFDIGANVGQFVNELRSVGYAEHVVSFEPLTSAHMGLVRAARSDARWVIHPRTAVGDADGSTSINVSGNSLSSSLLPMLDAHAAAASESIYVSSEQTPVARLDSVSSMYLNRTSRLFIKIDTQGFEWQVLQGASETIQRAQGVLLEVSLVPLYEGQKLWLELISWMESRGFTLWSVQKGFTDPVSGRSLQLDVVFLRV